MIAREQAYAFYAMALCGAVCGAGSDGLRFLARLLRMGAWAVGALDLILGIAAAAGMTTVGLYLRMDPFRLYAFAGVGCGWLLWRVSFGELGRRLVVLGRTILPKRTKIAGKVNE